MSEKSCGDLKIERFPRLLALLHGSDGEQAE